MSVEDCGNVALPSWSYSAYALDAEQQEASDPAFRIASLLLAKLADYVVPGMSLITATKGLSNVINILKWLLCVFVTFPVKLAYKKINLTSVQFLGAFFNNKAII